MCSLSHGLYVKWLGYGIKLVLLLAPGLLNRIHTGLKSRVQKKKTVKSAENDRQKNANTIFFFFLQKRAAMNHS